MPADPTPTPEARLNVARARAHDALCELEFAACAAARDEATAPLLALLREAREQIATYTAGAALPHEADLMRRIDAALKG